MINFNAPSGPVDTDWLYGAAAIGLFSRRVVGWSMSATMKNLIWVSIKAAAGPQSPRRDRVDMERTMPEAKAI